MLRTRGRHTREEKKRSVFVNMEDGAFHAERFLYQKEKKEFLEGRESLYKAKSLPRLFTNDPEFSARVLQVMSPRLEQIYVISAGPTHLSILACMPRLKRLELRGSQEFGRNDLSPFQWEDGSKSTGSYCANNPLDTTRPWRFDTGPPLDGGLVSLKVSLPRQVLFPFIALHRRTLRELIISADLPADSGDELGSLEYSWACNDMPERLADLVQRFPMESLHVLELNRHHAYSDHHIAKCDRQLLAVRQVMDRTVLVRCNRCG